MMNRQIGVKCVVTYVTQSKLT